MSATNSKQLRIWLHDVSNILGDTPTKSGNERSYHGFDISSGMFPTVPQKGISFHLQDMFKSFPEEFHGKFDLVHIRFVVAAITEDTYKDIVKSILPLLSRYTMVSHNGSISNV